MSLHGSNLGAWGRVADPPWWTCPLSTEQYQVLSAVAHRRVRRDLLFGRLEPHLLDGRDIGWTLRLLVIRGLVVLHPVGPPECTRRGADLLRSAD